MLNDDTSPGAPRLSGLAVPVQSGRLPPADGADAAGTPAGPVAIGETEAMEIWIARWHRVRRKDILARYGCDPRRLYDIWEGSRFPASREKALAEFARRWPDLVDRIDPSPHRRIPRPGPDETQLALFPTLPQGRSR
jgi:hypothetical protein